MTPVKENFNSMYNNTDCGNCQTNVPESDSHLLECDKIIENCKSLQEDYETEYTDIFGTIEDQVRATKLYDDIFQVKKKLDVAKED